MVNSSTERILKHENLSHQILTNAGRFRFEVLLKIALEYFLTTAMQFEIVSAPKFSKGTFEILVLLLRFRVH